MQKWKVSSNFINGKKYYRAYRLIDETAVDHSGNREYAGRYMERKEDAQLLADCLNKEDEPLCCFIKDLFCVKCGDDYKYIAADYSETALYAAIKGKDNIDVESIQWVGQVESYFDECDLKNAEEI